MKSKLFIPGALFIAAIFCCNHVLHAQYISAYKKDASGNTVLKSQSELQSELDNRNNSSTGYSPLSRYETFNVESRSERRADKERKKLQDYFDSLDAQKKSVEQFVQNTTAAVWENERLYTVSIDGHQYLVNRVGSVAVPIDGAALQQIRPNYLGDNGMTASLWLIKKGGLYAILYPTSVSTMALQPTGYTEMRDITIIPDDQHVLAVKDTLGNMAVLQASEGSVSGWKLALLTPLRFDTVYCFHLPEDGSDNNRIPVATKGKWGVWNADAQRLDVPCLYDSVCPVYANFSLSNPNANVYFVKGNGKWGVYSSAEQKEIIPAQYNVVAACDYSCYLYNNAKYKKDISFIGVIGDEPTYFNKNYKPVTPNWKKQAYPKCFYLLNGKEAFSVGEILNKW